MKLQNLHPLYIFLCLQAPPLESDVNVKLSICKKHDDDWNHFCNCFDKSGKEVTQVNQVAPTSAYYACCKCPRELREAIKNLKIHILETQAKLPVGQILVVLF